MEFTLKSGAALVITPSSFADANQLKKALMKSAKDLNISSSSVKDIKKMDVSAILNPVLDMCTSDEVEIALFKCFSRALYANQKVNQALFDDPKLAEQAREDYHEMCLKVIEVNCGPFFKQTFSMLNDVVSLINTSSLSSVLK